MKEETCIVHTEQFRAVAEQCDLIREEWQRTYALWRETASAEFLTQCKRLINDLHTACAEMDALIRQSMRAVSG